MLLTILTIVNDLLGIFFAIVPMLVWQPRFIGKGKLCALLAAEAGFLAAGQIRSAYMDLHLPVSAFYYLLFYMDTAWILLFFLILFWGKPIRWGPGFYGTMGYLLNVAIVRVLDSFTVSWELSDYSQYLLYAMENPLADTLRQIVMKLMIYGGVLLLMLLIRKFIFPRLHLEANPSPFLVVSEIAGIWFLDYLMLNLSYLSIHGYDQTYRVRILIGISQLLFQCAWALVILFLYRQIQSISREATQLATYEQQQRYAGELDRLNGQLGDFQRETARNLMEMGKAIEARDEAALEKCFSSSMSDRRINGQESQKIIRTLSSLKVIELKSLLLSKLNQMQALGIETTLDIPEPVEQIPMDLVDLTRTAGIFLDNALEAARQTSAPLVSLALFYRDGCLIFSVENTCLPLQHPLEKLMQKGVTTKENGRGMGLYIVSGILQNYPKITWNMECTGDRFREELEFYPENAASGQQKTQP